MKDFIYLTSGYVVNPDAISHIDFRKPTVAIHVGPNTISAEGADAVMLRDRFVPAPPPPAEAKAPK